MSWWQRSRAGDNSGIIQAGTFVVQGMTYSEVKEIVTDVVKHEIDKYNQTAFEVLWERVDEFSANYFYRQSTVAPDGMSSLREPFMQRAVRTAEVEFGASGNPEHGESLVDLLVNLSQTEFGSVQAQLLNDALPVVPKLTKQHLSALTAIFILKQTRMNALRPLDDLYKFLARNVVPLASLFPTNATAYRHLQFTQTGWIQGFEEPLGKTLQDNYGGILTEGFSRSEIPTLLSNSQLFIEHERYDDRVRMIAANMNALDFLIESNKHLEPCSEWLRETLTATRTAPDDIEAQLSSEVAGMGQVFDAWQKTNLGSFELTSLGMVIAHANWTGMGTGDPPPLDVYLKYAAG